MHCTRAMVDGTWTFVCGSKKLPTCHVCHAPADILCDFLLETTDRRLGVRRRKSCSKLLCAKCAVKVGHDRDFCPDHPGAASQMPLFGGAQ